MSDIDRLLRSVRKYGMLFTERQLISSEEYINSIYGQLAASDGACREVVIQICELVPKPILDLFVRSMRRATEPGFRWHPFHIGGNPPPQTDEVLRRSADLNTARLRDWALEFVRFWDEQRAI